MVIQACLKQFMLNQNNEDKSIVLSGLEILNKLINKILANPNDDKFKILNTNNDKVRSTLMQIRPEITVLEMFQVLGYVQCPQDPYIWRFQGKDLGLFKRLGSLVHM